MCALHVLLFGTFYWRYLHVICSTVSAIASLTVRGIAHRVPTVCVTCAAAGFKHTVKIKFNRKQLCQTEIHPNTAMHYGPPWHAA